ncbi:MAG TPA: hypothetical protein DEH11_15300 [Actinobacteria bacterium]|nr:hypothetical protein [Actinomycetota bacterium]
MSVWSVSAVPGWLGVIRGGSCRWPAPTADREEPRRRRCRGGRAPPARPAGPGCRRRRRRAGPGRWYQSWQS